MPWLSNFVGDRLSKAEPFNPSLIQPGEGKIVEVDSKKVAVYRDEQGQYTTLSPVCAHLRCLVDWNPGEKTWDCPCHGSRYDPCGHVIHGPAKGNLKKEDVDLGVKV